MYLHVDLDAEEGKEICTDKKQIKVIQSGNRVYREHIV